MVAELGLILAIKMRVATAPMPPTEVTPSTMGGSPCLPPSPPHGAASREGPGCPSPACPGCRRDPVLLDQEWEELRALGSTLGAEGCQAAGKT